MKTPATNKVLPKAGLNGFGRTFVQGSIPIAIGILRLNPAWSGMLKYRPNAKPQNVKLSKNSECIC
jgi:hypothetical protein